MNAFLNTEIQERKPPVRQNNPIHPNVKNYAENGSNL